MAGVPYDFGMSNQIDKSVLNQHLKIPILPGVIDSLKEVTDRMPAETKSAFCNLVETVGTEGIARGALRAKGQLRALIDEVFPRFERENPVEFSNMRSLIEANEKQKIGWVSPSILNALHIERE
jgi:hypothetical protein